MYHPRPSSPIHRITAIHVSFISHYNERQNGPRYSLPRCLAPFHRRWCVASKCHLHSTSIVRPRRKNESIQSANVNATATPLPHTNPLRTAWFVALLSLVRLGVCAEAILILVFLFWLSRFGSALSVAHQVWSCCLVRISALLTSVDGRISSDHRHQFRFNQVIVSIALFALFTRIASHKSKTTNRTQV